jgi:hypothetical protein
MGTASYFQKATSAEERRIRALWAHSDEAVKVVKGFRISFGAYPVVAGRKLCLDDFDVTPVAGFESRAQRLAREQKILEASGTAYAREEASRILDAHDVVVLYTIELPSDRVARIFGKFVDRYSLRQIDSPVWWLGAVQMVDIEDAVIGDVPMREISWQVLHPVSVGRFRHESKPDLDDDIYKAIEVMKAYWKNPQPPPAQPEVDEHPGFLSRLAGLFRGGRGSSHARVHR